MADYGIGQRILIKKTSLRFDVEIYCADYMHLCDLLYTAQEQNTVQVDKLQHAQV